jgi:uncharacterized protein YyaL (SSP411 family)
MRERFEDAGEGAFFTTPGDDPSLVLRIKDDYDGAEPSGNSVAIMNLLRLAAMTGRQELRDSAEKALKAFSGRLAVAPLAAPQMLAACEFALGPQREVVIVGDRTSPDTKELVSTMQRRFLPNQVALLVDGEETRCALSANLPAIAEMGKLRGRAAAYVCQNYSCRLPVSSPEEFSELLQ